ncbi:MAG: type II toxin-antitoxin system VapC family toxin [Rhodospirillaceae bacterium]|nr:type II toxin-antitoxin system VapC family toxin [Rhodospirillaceae bacterium]MBT4042038.1 type II toxin-antitoxin system VapC family toxin [Rhodospirillaceae bacterium]MBT4690352.1 type II toxin-antitoxin system VapC family toxin [Rhodospirillaceae bacterium]MBT5083081.1 type II toxin-antitoxin system VapC family toxin [Rhodospirillaceae bacterium]MBT5525764.1 type II toxin-antitoxin system VapC family toxin [Rhodospirillaceae bacterium]
MVLDTSAIIAIIYNEEERQLFIEIIDRTQARFLSAASLLETKIVLHRRLRESASITLGSFLTDAEIQIVDVTRQTSDIAFDAFLRYGKGQGKGAGLNFGDCFSYALAKEMDLPLLFKGNDFSQTDLVAAVDVIG